ncbi:GNAT family N-acetyltransferase [Marinobacter caseinilyticus]|uniref:GNAT family N-acetyltransferase n=1 Tax=Marinobacter caseinilyticus TaxID=2692195 RepID=UPI00140AA1FA|nr:GNAT family N-acetyltransferase [Marinobacter caseinilyticus]
MTLKIRKYSWQLAPDAVKDIRLSVFIDEQGVPPELEWDDTDAIADHFIALLPDNTPVAVARMYPSITDTAHFGRMAVVKTYRGRGYGQRLLRHMVTEAAPDFDDFYLSAQVKAIPFYQRAGFHVCSEPYDDAGIPHVDMRCFAPTLAINAQPNLRPRPLVVGQDNESWLFSSERDFIALTDSIASQARQRLWLYDRLLDHDHFDRLRFRELLSNLARRHRLSEVKLLIHHDKPLVQRRHQIIELMRRLPSKIQLRLVSPDHPTDDRAFMIADRGALIVRHGFDQPEGFANFSAPGHVKRQAESFQRMWDAGRPSVELRQLPL